MFGQKCFFSDTFSTKSCVEKPLFGGIKKGSLWFLGRISVHDHRDVQRLNKATEGSQPVDASFMTAASPGVVALFQVSINQFFWLQQDLMESKSL